MIGQKLLKARKVMIDFPLYLLTHPFKGFDDMKNAGMGSMAFAVVALILAGVVSSIEVAYTGFVVTQVWVETPYVYVPRVMLFTFSPILLFCLANWSITSITDGKGKMRDIFLTYMYALYPTLYLTLIGVFISNFLTLNEAAFSTFFFAFGAFLHLFLLFIGLIVIHEYTFFRAILMVVLTVLAMLIITFVMALMFSLFSNVIMIFWTVLQELNQHHLN